MACTLHMVMNWRAGCTLLAGIALLTGATAAQGAESNLPPAGRSLFDFVVTTREAGRSVEQVPFPFEALLAHIGERLDGGAETGIRAVLVPLGRSLQRGAAGDAAFRSPRVVAAVVAEPRSSGDMLLKDRLYLGYHERADMLEVISYNEAAGRFEFQVVRDYRAGAVPRVQYANRSMCLTCHQNRAPIFSRPPWDETNANPAIQRLLHADRRAFHGIAVELSVDAPNAIDAATDRANRFELVQRVWREGCELPAGATASIECRAQAFTAALKYRLGGSRLLDPGAPGYGSALLRPLATSWGNRWPHGIAVPSPDLPNRDPLAAFAASQHLVMVATALRRAAEVTPEFDPLLPREPIDLRTGKRPEDVAHFVRNLAEFISGPDIVALDHLLEEQHGRTGAGPQRVRVPCRVIERTRGARPSRILFGCVTHDGEPRFISLSGRLERQGDQLLGGAIDRSSPAYPGVREIGVRPAPITRTARGAEIELDLLRAGVALRLPDGNSVTRVTLRWNALHPTSVDESITGEADVWVNEDFAPVTDAIHALADASRNGQNDAFSARPFRRATVLSALFAQLGRPGQVWCCVDDAGMPPPAAVEDARGMATTPGLAPFMRACGSCHGGRENFPPGFLYGGAARSAANIDRCAERMLYRLAMWDVAPEARPKTPMPPAGANALPPADLDAMRAYLERRIQARAGTQPDRRRTHPAHYEELSHCAPLFG